MKDVLRVHEFEQTSEGSVYKELLSYAIEHFEKNGLKKDEVTKLKSALHDLPQFFEIPLLEKEWLETRDSDNLERALLTLAIIDLLKNSKKQQLDTKRFKGVFDHLYPEWARIDYDESKRPDRQFEAGRVVDFSNTATIATLSYRFHDKLFADKDFINTLCPDVEEQKKLSTPEGFLEYLYQLTPSESPYSFDQIQDMIMYRVQEFAKEIPDPENKNPIYEFDLHLTSKESKFLADWLEKKGVNNKSYLPQGIASKFPYKVSVFFAPQHSKSFTKEHERLHLKSSGFRIGSIGAGLDEGMTELLAEEEVFSRKGLIRKFDSQLHHKMQDRALLDRSSRNLFKWMLSFFADFSRDSSLIRHQSYDKEVAFLIRLFKKYPKIRPFFEKRYFTQRMEPVTQFAVEVINTLGLEFYLSLFLMEPYYEEGDDTSIVFMSAQRLADSL